MKKIFLTIIGALFAFTAFAQTWNCAKCDNEENPGNYCPECGTKRIEGEKTVEICNIPEHFYYVWTKKEVTPCGLLPLEYYEDSDLLELYERMSEVFNYKSPEEIDEMVANYQKAVKEIEDNTALSADQKKEILESVKTLSLIPDDVEAAKTRQRPDFQGMYNQLRNYFVGRNVYASLKQVHCNLFIAKDMETGRLGLIDAKCRTIMPFKYTALYASSQHPGYIIADIGEGDNDLMGFYTTTGKEILPCIYNYVGFVPIDNLIGVFDKKSLLGGFFDYSGKQLIPFQYTTYDPWVAQYKDGTSFSFILVRGKNGKDGIIDEHGKLVVPCIIKKNSVANNYDDKIDVIANDKPATLYFRDWHLEY